MRTNFHDWALALGYLEYSGVRLFGALQILFVFTLC